MLLEQRCADGSYAVAKGDARYPARRRAVCPRLPIGASPQFHWTAGVKYMCAPSPPPDLLQPHPNAIDADDNDGAATNENDAVAAGLQAATNMWGGGDDDNDNDNDGDATRRRYGAYGSRTSGIGYTSPGGGAGTLSGGLTGYRSSPGGARFVTQGSAWNIKESAS